MPFAAAIQPPLGLEIDDHAVASITGFRLGIGNNYTAEHFTRALCEDAPEVVDWIMSSDLAQGDLVEFDYRGTYGLHEDVWAVCDLMDYLRPLVA